MHSSQNHQFPYRSLCNICFPFSPLKAFIWYNYYKPPLYALHANYQLASIKKKSLVILCEDGLIRANCLTFIHMSQWQWWREIETGKLCWNPCKRKKSCLLWVVQPALHHSQRLIHFLSCPPLPRHLASLLSFLHLSLNPTTLATESVTHKEITQPTRKKSKLGEEKMFLFLN